LFTCGSENETKELEGYGREAGAVKNSKIPGLGYEFCQTMEQHLAYIHCLNKYGLIFTTGGL